MQRQTEHSKLAWSDSTASGSGSSTCYSLSIVWVFWMNDITNCRKVVENREGEGLLVEENNIILEAFSHQMLDK